MRMTSKSIGLLSPSYFFCLSVVVGTPRTIFHYLRLVTLFCIASKNVNVQSQRMKSDNTSAPPSSSGQS